MGWTVLKSCQHVRLASGEDSNRTDSYTRCLAVRPNRTDSKPGLRQTEGNGRLMNAARAGSLVT